MARETFTHDRSLISFEGIGCLVEDRQLFQEGSIGVDGPDGHFVIFKCLGKLDGDEGPDGAVNGWPVVCAAAGFDLDEWMHIRMLRRARAIVHEDRKRIFGIDG